MGKKKDGRGGKRPGAGRPPIDGVVKDARFTIALTSEELDLLKETNAREWAREVLIRSAKKRKGN